MRTMRITGILVCLAGSIAIHQLQAQAQGNVANAGMVCDITGICYAPTQRVEYATVAPGGFEALAALERYVQSSGLERSLLLLVKSRVSQINGCAFCLDMHTKDARSGEEQEQRLFLLSVWREAPCYTERERAALAWAEAVTLIASNEIGDDLYNAVRTYFNEKELVDLTYCIVAINSWNRLAIASRTPVGYKRTR